jgi:DNA-binding XRE family transcriptional regulator
MTKSTRDYIKNFGRTALRNRDTQTIDMGDAGFISVFYHPLDQDYVWRGQVQYRGRIYSTDCNCQRDAETWVNEKYKYLTSTVTLGMWIENMMEEHNVSPSYLASSIQVSRMTLHQWCKDTRQPTVDNWIALARFWSTQLDCATESMLSVMSNLHK